MCELNYVYYTFHTYLVVYIEMSFGFRLHRRDVKNVEEQDLFLETTNIFVVLSVVTSISLYLFLLHFENILKIPTTRSFSV